MKLVFLADSRVMFTTWDKKSGFKSYDKGDRLENIGVTDNLVDKNMVTISYNKNSFIINKNLIKIE